MFPLLLLYSSSFVVTAEKCYSCSSPQLQLRWPRNDETNQLYYLREFPWFANESCEQMKSAIPVVDCPGSVCIKAVITEPPAKREVCVKGSAIVRDCWSRVVAAKGKLALDPKARRNVVKLSEDESADRFLGVIYTCEGFLCNSTPTRLTILSFLIVFLSL